MRIRGGSAIAGALVMLAAGAVHAGAAAPEPRWIVFSAAPKGTPPAQLFRVRTNGAGLEQITSGSGIATDPDFSLDGKRIAFARLGSGIYVANVDGSGLHRLTSGVRDHFPVWSPNGARIAFLRLHKSAWRLYVMSASGRDQRRLPLAPAAGRPSWSADGKSIFTPGQGALERVDARTGRVLKRMLFQAMDPSVSQAATVSPGARRVAFVGHRASAPGCGDVSCVRFGLYLAKLPAGGVRRVVNDAGPAGWSPDGKTLVFVRSGALQLWPVAGGKSTTIAVTDAVPEGTGPPAWQPR